MDAGNPGNEALVCVAMEQDLYSKLPSTLKGPSFTPIAGLRGVTSIEDAYTAALGRDQFVVRSLEWKVVARRAVAAAPAPAPAAGAVAK
jgi:hypothetical protein